MATTTLKQCRGCHVVKPLGEFYSHPRMADGRLNYCKSCVKGRIAQHRVRNDSVREYDRRRYRENPHRQAQLKRLQDKTTKEQRRAYKIVEIAIQKGELVRPTVCPRCLSERFCEAHHHDYAKPMEIEWLCRSCHCREHQS